MIYALIKSGALDSVQIGTARRVPRAACDAYVGELMNGAVSVDDWLTTWAKGQAVRVAESTLSGYRDDLRHVAKSIGTLRLDKVTAEDVKRLYRDMLDAGYAPGTVLHAKRRLSAALQAAVDRGRMNRNPVRRAVAPKDQPPDIEPLTKEQARRLLAEARGQRDDECRLHDARHTAATLLLVAGVADSTVMDQMGWTTAVLLSRYSLLTRSSAPLLKVCPASCGRLVTWRGRHEFRNATAAIAVRARGGLGLQRTP